MKLKSGYLEIIYDANLEYSIEIDLQNHSSEDNENMKLSIS